MVNDQRAWDTLCCRLAGPCFVVAIHCGRLIAKRCFFFLNSDTDRWVYYFPKHKFLHLQSIYESWSTPPVHLSVLYIFLKFNELQLPQLVLDLVLCTLLSAVLLNTPLSAVLLNAVFSCEGSGKVVNRARVLGHSLPRPAPAFEGPDILLSSRKMGAWEGEGT